MLTQKKIELKVKSQNADPVATPATASVPISAPKIAIQPKAKVSNNLALNLAPLPPSPSVKESQILIVKNGHILDPYCQFKNGCVYQDYSCTLNMTDLKDNKNKFYIMQIIEVGAGNYQLMKRYGRIGEKGVTNYTPSSNPSHLADEFTRVFKDKSGNTWANRTQFTAVKGKYYLCAVDYANEIQTQVASATAPIPVSKLDSQVRHFLNLVSDRQMMDASLLRLEIDVKKMPLGKLSQSQLKKAYDLLSSIQVKISESASKTELMDLSSEFYILIPCVSSSRVTRLPTIDNNQIVSRLMSVVDELSNLQIAHQVLSTTNSKLHPLDAMYEELKTVIRPLTNSAMIDAIRTYVKNTHGKTHTGYGVEVVNIYEIEREGERQRYDQYCQTNQIQNKMLLWHGTRLSNYISILKMGLVLRSDLIPGTVVTGRMFSMGLYGANSFSKSFNYTGYDYHHPVQCLFLAEFALGNQDYRTDADYYITEKSLQKNGYHSVKGCGRNTPSSEIVIDGVNIPQGQLVKSQNAKQCSLRYDEFIVYNEAQVNLKYIVEVKATSCD